MRIKKETIKEKKLCIYDEDGTRQNREGKKIFRASPVSLIWAWLITLATNINSLLIKLSITSKYKL